MENKNNQKINPDLQEERDKVSFDVSEFSKWYHGGEDKLEEKRFLGNKQNKNHVHHNARSHLSSLSNLQIIMYLFCRKFLSL